MVRRHGAPRAIAGVIAAVAVMAAGPTAAFAKKPVGGGSGGGGGGGGGTGSTGYDISYPQCSSGGTGTALGSAPSAPAFGIVGVNDGIAWSPNPCLAAEYQWALTSTSTTQPHASFYANTANPGPSSSHWLLGGPKACDGTQNDACAYDYGWNTAANSFQDAAAVSGQAAAAAARWWLDVESANSWVGSTGNNVADLQGALDYLNQVQGVGLANEGIYTNASSWSSVTGGSTALAGYPSWRPGAMSLSGAQANCSSSITGGKVTLAQYPSGGYDADYPCP